MAYTTHLHILVNALSSQYNFLQPCNYICKYANMRTRKHLHRSTHLSRRKKTAVAPSICLKSPRLLGFFDEELLVLADGLPASDCEKSDGPFHIVTHTGVTTGDAAQILRWSESFCDSHPEQHAETNAQPLFGRSKNCRNFLHSKLCKIHDGNHAHLQVYKKNLQIVVWNYAKLQWAQ